MQYKNYSVEELTEAVRLSTSYRQVMIKIGLAPQGGNYRSLRNIISRNNLDTSHFTGQGWNKNKKIGPKRPIEDYLSNKFPIQSLKLKKRLLEEGFFEHKCYSCNLTEWLDKPIPLELHHKDGNHNNNNLDNLTLICPNCHADTPNYRGKNIDSKITSIKLKESKEKSINPKRYKLSRKERSFNTALKNGTLKECLVCKKQTSNMKYCSYKCSRKSSRKTERPTKEELQKLLETASYVKVGKMFGVSDNAIRKWLK